MRYFIVKTIISAGPRHVAKAETAHRSTDEHDLDSQATIEEYILKEFKDKIGNQFAKDFFGSSLKYRIANLKEINKDEYTAYLIKEGAVNNETLN